jgi:thiosulfate dehydrogenase [quinone] large subunit
VALSELLPAAKELTMSTVNHLQDHHAPTETLAATHVEQRSNGADGPAPPSRWLAVLRVAIGFIFLWSFLDKLLGLGYTTESGSSWLDGASPTEGFLRSIAVGPFDTTFNGWAGQAWPDWLFMAGMGGVGIAAVLGVALRFTAISGTLMLGFLWASQWPPAQHTATGEPSGSNNPLVDTHVIYALVLIVLAVTQAGHRWGLGRRWGQLPLVRRYTAVLS